MVVELLKPSEVKQGMLVADEREEFYYVLGAAEQPDGTWCLRVRYTDGGAGLREFDDDSATIPHRVVA